MTHEVLVASRSGGAKSNPPPQKTETTVLFICMYDFVIRIKTPTHFQVLHMMLSCDLKQWFEEWELGDYLLIASTSRE
ncbi:hypothetical protein O3P69_003342 [Scylla paramamosain]|uniref:Uncharacterized protein n=1 Tax=Scylla paramamosain TaxID=85552 RepID=A0AAW0UM65_SCYPA